MSRPEDIIREWSCLVFVRDLMAAKWSKSDLHCAVLGAVVRRSCFSLCTAANALPFI